MQVDAAKKVIKKLKMKCYSPEAFENPDLQVGLALSQILLFREMHVNWLFLGALRADRRLGLAARR
jgi:hypothetical protein